MEELKKQLEEPEKWIDELREYFSMSDVEKYRNEDTGTIDKYYAAVKALEQKNNRYLTLEPEKLMAMQTGLRPSDYFIEERDLA